MKDSERVQYIYETTYVQAVFGSLVLDYDRKPKEINHAMIKACIAEVLNADAEYQASKQETDSNSACR